MQGLKGLISRLKKYKKNLVLSIFSNIMLSIFTVVSIPLIQPFLEILFNATPVVLERPDNYNFVDWINYYLSDIIAQNGRMKALVAVCVFIIIVFLLKNLFRYLALFFMVAVRNGIVADIRQDLFNKYMDLPLSYLAESKKGDLISRLTADVVEIEWSILNMIESIFKSPIIMLGCITYMLYVSPQLTIFVFFLMIFTVFIIGGVSKTLKKSSSKVQGYLAEINSITEESLGGMRIIKAFGAEKYQASKFEKENFGFLSSLNKLMYRKELSSPLSEFLGVTLVAILLWYGGQQVLAGDLNAGTFFAYIFAFFQVIEPSKALSTAYYNVQKGRAALDRIDQILAIQKDVVDESSAISKTNFDHQIVFDKVSFAYDIDQKVLDDVSFSFKKGQVVALVGASGAGKSTLVDLLPRFFNVTSGKISMDDVNINDIKIADLRSMYGMVSQDPVLFNDTIKNNICFGKDYTKEEIEDAAKVANIHDFILTLPDGYETNIGDRGVKLSGGQRQRLTIARAVLDNPPILILDEATSALDSESEKLVQQALEKIMKSRTSVVIAHRLSTIINADIIFVMDNGRLVEQGSHDYLMMQNGFYKKFVEMQSIS
jgi:subfamily B ATP-binding cassette protein MsbA